MKVFLLTYLITNFHVLNKFCFKILISIPCQKKQVWKVSAQNINLQDLVIKQQKTVMPNTSSV